MYKSSKLYKTVWPSVLDSVSQYMSYGPKAALGFYTFWYLPMQISQPQWNSIMDGLGVVMQLCLDWFCLGRTAMQLLEFSRWLLGGYLPAFLWYSCPWDFCPFLFQKSQVCLIRKIIKTAKNSFYWKPCCRNDFLLPGFYYVIKMIKSARYCLHRHRSTPASSSWSLWPSHWCISEVRGRRSTTGSLY